VIIKFLLGLTLIALPQLTLAQETDDADKDRQYVTDQLRLSLYQDSSSQSKVLKLLRSGDMLIIDEIRGPYALVTAPDGTHGWVKRGFLVSSPTANILLREEQEKNAGLLGEIEKFGNSKVIIDTYEKDMDEMAVKIDGLETSNSEAGETIAELEQEIEEWKQEQAEAEAAAQLGPDGKPLQREPAAVVLWRTFRAYWEIIASILFGVILVSFLFSKVIIEARIKNRFHGIKIW